MKKLLKNPFVLIILTMVIFAGGTVYGRHTAPNQIHIKEYTKQDKSTAESSGSAEIPREADNDEEYIIADQIDINTASTDTLTMLPGIGPTFAQRIVDYREENGPYKSVDDLLLVEGFGEKRVDSIRKYICVGEN